MSFLEAPNNDSFAGLVLAQSEDITNEYAQKLASSLSGFCIHMFLPSESAYDSRFVRVRLLPSLLGYGSSAIAVGATVGDNFGDYLQGYAVRLVPRRAGPSRVNAAAERFTSQLGLDIHRHHFKHLVGALAAADREAAFEAATLHRVYEPLDRVLKKWRALNGNTSFMKQLTSEQREMFAGSLLLSLMTSVMELNSHELQATVSTQTGFSRDQIICVAHYDIKQGNIFLDADSPFGAVLRLGDIESVAPCLKNFAEATRTATFTTFRFAPPELREEGIVAPRCSLWMAASTVCEVCCDFTTFPINERNPIQAAVLAEMMGVPSDSPVINVLCGCLTGRWQNAMSLDDAMRLLNLKYSVDLAAQHVNRLRSDVLGNSQLFFFSDTTDTASAAARLLLPPPADNGVDYDFPDTNHSGLTDQEAKQDAVDCRSPTSFAQSQGGTWGTARGFVEKIQAPPHHKIMELTALAASLASMPYAERHKLVLAVLPVSETDPEYNIIGRAQLLLFTLHTLFPLNKNTMKRDLSNLDQLRSDLALHYPGLARKTSSNANKARLEEENIADLMDDLEDAKMAVKIRTDAATLLFKLANRTCEGILKDQNCIRTSINPTLRLVYNLSVALGLLRVDY